MPKRPKIVHETDGLPQAEDFAACRQCNRALKNPKWRRIGYGPKCLEIARYARVMEESGQAVPERRKRAQATPSAPQIDLL